MRLLHVAGHGSGGQQDQLAVLRAIRATLRNQVGHAVPRNDLGPPVELCPSAFSPRLQMSRPWKVYLHIHFLSFGRKKGWATAGGVQSLALILCSQLIPGGAQGPLCTSRDQTGADLCKANTLSLDLHGSFSCSQPI